MEWGRNPIGSHHRFELMSDWLKSFRFALTGLRQTVRTQRNFRIQLVLGTIAIGMGVGFSLTLLEWAILVLTIVIVLSGELFNTALEALVDLVSPEFRPLAKTAKDCAAGAVLVSAIGSVAVGLLLFGPRLWALILGGGR